jgi:site-specific DNA-cytosine methylase
VRNLTAVGCNIFAGGFTLGVEKHFNVLAHLEHNSYGVNTFKLNRPWIPVHYPGPQGWPLDRYREPDLLYSNPPCAIVSACGRCLRQGRDSWRTDPRTQRVRDITKLTLDLRPRIMAMESVTQMYTTARELVDEQVSKLVDAGYSITHLMVNTAWHGVPQVRKRYFLLAHRVGLSFERLNYAPPDTVGEVLRTVTDPGYLSCPNPEHVALYHDTKPGRSLRETWERHHPDESQWVRGPHGVWGRPKMLEYRARADEPLGVFYGDFVWHPTEPRRLGLEECKAICGFPADWQFYRPKAGFSELARGVMPGMADWLARQLARSIRESDGLGMSGPRVMEIDLRRAPT